MKSSYELAMERLNKQNPQPTVALTEAQKKAIAELDSLYKSKIAEKELFLKPKIEAAEQQGDVSTVESMQKQLRDEIHLLREEWQDKKEKIRTSGV